MKKFQVVFFEPVAGSGWRIPVAALLTEPGRPTTAVAAEAQPDAQCVGGLARENLLRYGLNFLRHSAELNGLPSVLGDQFLLGSERHAPPEVQNLPKWVREHVLPRRLGKEARKGHEQRTTIGRRALGHIGLGAYIRTGFQFDEWTRGVVPRGLLVSTSQWVRMKEDGAMLLEPLTFSTASPMQEIQSVYSKWSTYKVAEAQYDLKAISRVTYLAPTTGAAGRFVYEAAQSLKELSWVCDLNSEADRQLLTERIKTNGLIPSPQRMLN